MKLSETQSIQVTPLAYREPSRPGPRPKTEINKFNLKDLYGRRLVSPTGTGTGTTT
jgi:hypothetical protein